MRLETINTSTEVERENYAQKKKEGKAEKPKQNFSFPQGD